MGNLQQFERFLRASALRSGQLLNRAELARDVGIAPSTAGLWLSVLERSGLVFLLEPWFGNAGKRLIRSPKLYWRDTGLLCWLIGIGSEADLARSHLVGAAHLRRLAQRPALQEVGRPVPLVRVLPQPDKACPPDTVPHLSWPRYSMAAAPGN